MNLVDLGIILVLIFYGLEGAGAGFIDSILDLLTFLISFTFGLLFYSFFGNLLIDNFAIPNGFANAIGFFLGAFLVEIFANFLLKNLLFQNISKVFQKKDIAKKLNILSGALFSVFSGILLISFILTMIITLPLSPVVKRPVSSSKIAKILTSNTQTLSATINSVFGGAVNETLSFLTVAPQGNESVNLNFTTSDFKIDSASESEMLGILNKERVSRGIKPLSLGSAALIDVGRSHCKDMFKRGYFSHYTPEGLSPFDRMTNSEITFTQAGENLALAPNVELATRGLMQSPGHRENILSADFGRVGIGVIDGGIYGEMFCQEFTD